MNAGPFTLLAVAEEGHSWDFPESLIGGRFRLHYAAFAQVESRLQGSPVDAVFVKAERFTEDLPKRIKSWKGLRPKAQFFLFLSETPSTRALVSLMHAGCQDVVDTATSASLDAILDSVAERVHFVRVHQFERLRVRQSLEYTGLVGHSPEMVKIFDEMLCAARLSCPVLVLGETGTGKGLVAHAIHALSERSGKPFVTVDCGCLAPTLIESELYGVARGAYTGASSDRAGLVQAAQEGTLFLDEIGELPLGMQPKLLRLLEEGEVRRLGSHRATTVDVRVISATSRELESLIAAEQFRLDLFYRLNVLTIEIAPLRQRPQDVPLLARHFASCHVAHGESMTISDAAISVLTGYSWPGNVRELKNCIEAAIASVPGTVIQPQHLPRRFRTGPSLSSLQPDRDSLNLKQVERRAIRRALEIANQDKMQAARLLGIGKTTLYRKLKEMEEEFRPLNQGGPYLM